jgi:hypothetical protein
VIRHSQWGHVTVTGHMSAIQSALERIRAKLDSSFKIADPRTEDWVILSNLMDHAGNPYIGAQGKMVMFLAGIQHETVVNTHGGRTTPISGDKSGGIQHGIVSPPLYVNLLVLFFANFYNENYPVGLGMISRTIGFFQQNPFFTHDTLPGLDPAIDKLTLELMNLDLTQANYLMGMMGVKYLPAVLYRVRMIPFRSDAVTGVVPAARSLKPSGAPDPTEPTDPSR